MCSRNSLESPVWRWISSSDCSHWCVRDCSSERSESSSLYSQCAATPLSATWCMSLVRIWNSTGVPYGPISVVCSDW